MKLDNLIKAHLPSGEPVTLDRVTQVQQISKILLDPNVPSQIKDKLTMGNNALAELAGIEAIRETARGKIVIGPTKEELATTNLEAQKSWAIAEALKASGTAELSEIRALVDKLGAFAIIPFSALNKMSYTKESDMMQKAIKNFNDWATSIEGLTTWVVAPVHHYDVCSHALAGGKGVPYAGPACRTQLETIQMNMPLYVEMIGRTDVLDTRVTGLETRMNRVETTSKQHAEKLAEHERRMETIERVSRAQAEQLESLKNRVEEEARARVIAQREAENRAQQAREERWVNEDPLIIAVNGSSVSGDGRVIMGPCWGPDLTAIVTEAFNLNIISDSRKPGSAELWSAIA